MRGVVQHETRTRLCFMGNKYKRLFPQIVSPDNLHRAYCLSARGKSRSSAYLRFREYAPVNLANLRQELLDGSYTPGQRRTFYIHDPKPRVITAIPFRDRIVQHAVNSIVEPIMDRTMLPYTFACRKGMGTHAGVKHVQKNLRRTDVTHFLKTDFSKYFPSIHVDTALSLVEAKIKCRRTTDLIRSFFSFERIGLPIGALLSQLLANLYGTIIDNFVHHTIRPVAWARYMDDTVLLDNDPLRLRDAKDRIAEVAKTEMGMEFSKWYVAPLSRGVNFLGFRIWPTHKLLRKQSVTRARRTLAALGRRGDTEALVRFNGAWLGHAKHADSHNLLRTLGYDYEQARVRGG